MESPGYRMNRLSIYFGFLELQITISYLFSYLFIKLLNLFLDRGEGREKKRERNINVWLPLVHPPLGTWPTT